MKGEEEWVNKFKSSSANHLTVPITMSSNVKDLAVLAGSMVELEFRIKKNTGYRIIYFG